MRVDEARAIWLDILRRQRRIPRSYRLRLKRLKFGRGGTVKTHVKRKLKDGEEFYVKEKYFEFTERHFPSLLRKFEREREKQSR